MSLETSEFRQPQTTHTPVMPVEVMRYLGITLGVDGLWVDGTAGGGGHSEMIVKALNRQGRLIAFDRDPEACARATQRLQPWIDSGQAQVRHGSFADLEALPDADYAAKIDGIFLDLGLSSFQTDDARRGFSFTNDGPLDMRMDATQGPTAADILNQYPTHELRRMFRDYADEPRAAKLARAIETARLAQPLTRTAEFRELILNTLRPHTPNERMKLLSRNFMALRMEVNGELELLRLELDRAVTLTKPGGKIVILSFHSGEDRVVKHYFREAARDCICPPQQPRCICDHRAKLKILTKKPVSPQAVEVAENTRARSALLRAAERL